LDSLANTDSSKATYPAVFPFVKIDEIERADFISSGKLALYGFGVRIEASILSEIEVTKKQDRPGEVQSVRINKKRKEIIITKDNELKVKDCSTAMTDARIQGKELFEVSENDFMFFHLQKSMRYAKEDTHCIWEKESGDISIVDVNTWKEKALLSNVTGKECRILLICVSQDLTKLYTYAKMKEESIFSICIMDSDLEVSDKNYFTIPKSFYWGGMELTTNSQDLIVVSGRDVPDGDSAKTLKITAYDTDTNNLNIKKSRIEFTDPDLVEPKNLCKVKGYDIFMVCSYSNILVFAFSGTNFAPLHKLRNIYGSDSISDLILRGNYALPLAVDSRKTLKAIQFNFDSYNSMVSRERTPERLSRLDQSRLQTSIFKDEIKKIFYFDSLGNIKFTLR